MPKVELQAVLRAEDMPAVMQAARSFGPQDFAVTAWCYEFGARAAEPGLQKLSHLDLYGNRAQIAHLKSGRKLEWVSLMPYCREALPLWLEARAQHVTRPEHEPFLFPTHSNTGRCYTCEGTGKRPILKRVGDKRFRGAAAEDLPCHHCNATGFRWGINRLEVYAIIPKILKAAGVPEDRRHPHVLRHSIISHMLDVGVAPSEVRDRVGHKQLSTTLLYAKSTPSAGDDLAAKMTKAYKK